MGEVPTRKHPKWRNHTSDQDKATSKVFHRLDFIAKFGLRFDSVLTKQIGQNGPKP